MFKDTKLLLTTSSDKDVIIAEVERNHKPNIGKEYFISRATLNANILQKRFVEVTKEVDWNGRVWMLATDMRN